MFIDGSRALFSVAAAILKALEKDVLATREGKVFELNSRSLLDGAFICDSCFYQNIGEEIVYLFANYTRSLFDCDALLKSAVQYRTLFPETLISQL